MPTNPLATVDSVHVRRIPIRATRNDIARALNLACEGGAALHALVLMLDAMEAGDSSIHGADAKVVLQALVRHGSDHVELLVQLLDAAAPRSRS